MLMMHSFIWSNATFFEARSRRGNQICNTTEVFWALVDSESCCCFRPGNYVLESVPFSQFPIWEPNPWWAPELPSRFLWCTAPGLKMIEPPTSHLASVDYLVQSLKGIHLLFGRSNSAGWAHTLTAALGWFIFNLIHSSEENTNQTKKHMVDLCSSSMRLKDFSTSKDFKKIYHKITHHVANHRDQKVKITPQCKTKKKENASTIKAELIFPFSSTSSTSKLRWDKDLPRGYQLSTHQDVSGELVKMRLMITGSDTTTTERGPMTLTTISVKIDLGGIWYIRRKWIWYVFDSILVWIMHCLGKIKKHHQLSALVKNYICLLQLKQPSTVSKKDAGTNMVEKSTASYLQSNS